MIVPLWILAILSLVGGAIGWPHALGGHDWFAAFLAPLWPEMPHGAHGSLSTEWLLMGLTLGIALGGILAARRFYLTNPEAAAAWAARLRPVQTLLQNKYWVDELYDFLFVRPLVACSRWLWRVMDVGIIDGFVNFLARGTTWTGVFGARAQTGTLRNYILVFTVGVVIALGYFALDWSW